MKLTKVLIACLLIGCGTHTEAPTMTRTDSLIVASDSVIAKAECSGKNLDSVTTATAEKITGNIDQLTKVIDEYETRIKCTMKVKSTEKIIRDTVYIETKKSFWGKTKRNITTTSDSSIDQIEILDTTNSY